MVHRASRGSNYTPREDTIICQMVADNRLPDAIGKAIGRTGEQVQQRIWRLRKNGTIPGYSPRRRVLEVSQKAVTMDPPIRLRLDDDLVRYTLREGGFPTAVVTSAGTVWVGPDGMAWRHGRQVAEALAA